MSENSELTRLFASVLKMCRLQSSESMIVLAEGDNNAQYADAYIAAALEIGAEAIKVAVPARSYTGEIIRGSRLSGNQLAVAAMSQADLVIDTLGMLWSKEQRTILESGTRVLMSRESPDVIARLLPTPGLRERVEASVSMLKAAKNLRITSESGTDVSYELGDRITGGQYGYTDQPGRWDNLPSGFVATCGNDGGVNGTVVLDPGSILLPTRRYVTSPVTLKIVKGQIVDIDGDGLDTMLLRTYIERWKDPQAFEISHIGWGLHENAHWDTLGMDPAGRHNIGMEYRSYYGNVLFTTGPNTEYGGTNNSRCHLDIPLRGCSAFLDGEQFLENGEFTKPELRA